jgi:hypothetical protein
MIINYDHNYRFVILATTNMIINYDCKTVIVQATDGGTSHKNKLLGFITTTISFTKN